MKNRRSEGVTVLLEFRTSVAVCVVTSDLCTATLPIGVPFGAGFESAVSFL